MAQSLEAEMSKILEDYYHDIEKASEEASKEAANETVKILKAISPTGKSLRSITLPPTCSSSRRSTTTPRWSCARRPPCILLL